MRRSSTVQCTAGVTDSRCGHEITIGIASAKLFRPHIHVFIYNVYATEIIDLLQLRPESGWRRVLWSKPHIHAFIYNVCATEIIDLFKLRPEPRWRRVFLFMKRIALNTWKVLAYIEFQTIRYLRCITFITYLFSALLNNTFYKDVRMIRIEQMQVVSNVFSRSQYWLRP